MGNFLELAYKQSNPCTLYVQGKRLVGMKLPEKDFHRYTMNIILPRMLVVFGGAFLLFFWPIEPLFLPAGLTSIGVRELKNVVAGKSLMALGATPLSASQFAA